jgi:outer membrane protein
VVKRTVLLLIVILVCVAGSFRASPVCAGEDEPALSLDDARRLALSGNASYSMAKLDFNAAEIQFEMSQADALMRPSVVAVKKAENARKNTARALVAKEQALMLDVDSAYYSLLSAQMRWDIREKAEEQAKDALRIVTLKYDAGLASKVEVISAEIQLQRASSETLSAEGDLELAALTFKQMLGLSLDTKVVALGAPESIAEDREEIDFDKDLARVLANRPEIVEIRDALEIAELEVEFSDNDYTPELAKRLYSNTLEKIRLQFDQVKQGVQIEARRLYLAVQNAERGMEVAQAVAVQAEENYKIMKLRYEYGMEIANTLLGAQVNLTEAKDKPRSAGGPLSLSAQTLSRTRTGSPEDVSSVRRVCGMSRPTIIRAKSFTSASFVNTVSTSLPLRSTVTRSDTAITSLSLWVIRMIARPESAIPLITPISSSAS